MSDAPGSNADQAAYWSSPPGLKWIDHEARLDDLLSRILVRLLELAAPAPGEAVIDVGCGTGASTLALSSAVAPGGRVVGVDISEPLVARARARTADVGATNAELLAADAQSHAFAPGAFDLVASRFGVMFFSDPTAAFANLRQALRPGGRLCFAAWGPMESNLWFTVPQAAAEARLGPAEGDPPGSPGPFGLSDRERTLAILRQAGFADGRAEVETVDLVVEGGLAEAAALATSLGPAVRILAEKHGTAEDAAAVAKAVADRLAPFAAPGSVRVPGEVNFFLAVRA